MNTNELHNDITIVLAVYDFLRCTLKSYFQILQQSLCSAKQSKSNISCIKKNN